MPPKKSNAASSYQSGKVMLGIQGKGGGGGSSVQVQATQPMHAPNWQRTQATSAPRPLPMNPAYIPRPGDRLGPPSGPIYRERPLLRPIAFVPGVHTRVLFSCDHEEEAKQVENDVKEELVHVENVDALDVGTRSEVDEGRYAREDTAINALAIGSVVLAFRDMHIRPDPSEGTPMVSAISSKLRQGHGGEAEGAQHTAVPIPNVPSTIELHVSEVGMGVTPPLQDTFSSQRGDEKGHGAMSETVFPELAVTVVPKNTAYMATVLQMLRKSANDVSGQRKLAIPPPNDKEIRKYVYELASAFHMTGAKSKGSGANIALKKVKCKKAKTKRVDEKKVAAVMKKFAPPGTQGSGFMPKNSVVAGKIPSKPFKGGSGKVQKPGHKEGDIIGKAAPKIDASNVGFKMLATMGWSDGEKIGSGGLGAPIDAVIKRSKLGLGAT